MKRCKRCNKLLNDHAKYCTTCGASCEDSAGAVISAEHAFGCSAEAEPVQKEASAVQRKTAEQAKAAPQPAPTRQQSIKTSKSRKSSKKKKRRAVMLALLIAALCIVIAIVVIAVRGCKKASAVSSGASADAPAALGEGPAAPDPSAVHIEMMDLTGLPLPDAAAKLTDAGLVADVYKSGYDPAYGDDIVLSQSVAAGELLQKGDHVTLSVNVLPLSLEVLQSSVRSGRITLSNVVEVCRSLGTNNPNFDYSIVVHAVDDYEFKGSFRCLVGTGEVTPISRVNTQFLRNGASVKGFMSAVPYKDSVVWAFALEDWMGFHFENVTGYDVTLASQADPSNAVRKAIPPESTKSMALVDCPVDNGRIRIDIPAADALTIRITDSALPNGYTNSPDAKGAEVPLWEIKLVIGSYQWISATVDGSDAADQHGMQAFGKKFVQKGSQPVPYDGVTYTVEGDVMVVSVPLPSGMDFDPYAISYIELNFGDGAYSEKIKIR